MNPPIIIFAAVLTLVGCAGSTSVHESEVPRFYAMSKGGFSERLTIELKRNGRYEMNHRLISDTIGADGVIQITHGIEEGHWTLSHGQVTLVPHAQSRDFLNDRVFVPAVARRLVPQREGSVLKLVSADYPETFVMKETKPWDQARDPFFQPK